MCRQYANGDYDDSDPDCDGRDPDCPQYHEVTCKFCGCGDEGEDIVVAWWDDAANEQVVAHAQCGEDNGLRLA